MKKCRSAWVVMSQTKFAATALDERINDNLSVPYGLIRTVRHYLEFVGVLSYIRGLKSKGVRLDLIVVALCTYNHAHIEFDERLRRMAQESRSQETARILAEGRDLAEDSQHGHRHIGREPRRHRSPAMEGHQIRIFQAGIGPANDNNGCSRQVPPQGGCRASDLIPQAHNGDQAEPGMEQGLGRRLHDPRPFCQRRPSLWPAIAYPHTRIRRRRFPRERPRRMGCLPRSTSPRRNPWSGPFPI